MTYSLSNNCTKNYYNRTLTVQVIVEDVVTWIFLKHSVVIGPLIYRDVYIRLFVIGYRLLIYDANGQPFVEDSLMKQHCFHPLRST